MLIRRVLTSLVCGLVAFALAPAAGAAALPRDVTCPPTFGPCQVDAKSPGSPGGTQPIRGDGDQSDTGDRTGNAADDVCRYDGEVWPCHNEFGSFDEETGCYVQPVVSQPPKSSAVWEGHTSGTIYDSTCPGGFAGTGGGWFWAPEAPAGAGPDRGPRVSPAELARRAVDRLPIAGPDIHMAPRLGSTGLVGMPVWMWTPATDRTWGPASATASAGDVSVTARAEALRVVWDMGDGSTVTCGGPGTPYDPSYGKRMSPTCGYRYTESSALEPGGSYEVTATTTWTVTWSGGGESGELRVTRSSTAGVRIGEMQVLVQ